MSAALSSCGEKLTLAWPSVTREERSPGGSRTSADCTECTHALHVMPSISSSRLAGARHPGASAGALLAAAAMPFAPTTHGHLLSFPQRALPLQLTGAGG